MAQDHSPKPEETKPETIEDGKLDDVSGGMKIVIETVMVPSVTPAPKPRP